MSYFGKLIFFSLIFITSGCYEGWEYNNGIGPGNGEPPKEKADKDIYYLLFEPIRLTSAAMENETCFPNSGTKEYKKNEWDLRVEAIEESMKGIAETYVKVDRDISESDCLTLSTISAAASEIEPWGDKDPPVQDKKNRYTVELKAVFWEGDVGLVPPSLVTKTHWAAWTILEASGIPVLSLHYFVLSNEDKGYFYSWRSKLKDDVKLNGTPINEVDPTPAGMSKRTETVKSDTEALVKWIRGEL